MIWLFLIAFVLFFIFSTFFRTIVLHPFLTVYYAVRDFIKYLKERKWHFMKSGYIICFVGLFGKGKTLATVHYVLQLYKKYNGKKVYDPERKKFVLQRVNVISNVNLQIPYVEFTGLQQLVDISKTQHDFDLQNDCLTQTIVLGDEFSVQLNSRSFKSNIDPLFLNTLLTCRHHHITLVYNAQRFNHVDALLRQVTSYVYDCDKIWRVMCHKKYDAWDLECASSPSLVKPLRSFGWFIRNKDFAAYDTYACVGNLIKSCESGDMLSEDDILKLQAAATSADDEAVAHASRRLRKLRKRKVS